MEEPDPIKRFRLICIKGSRDINDFQKEDNLPVVRK
jgi:hypothetical protein